MYDVTKLVNKKVLGELIRRLPAPKQKIRGRKRVIKEALLIRMLTTV